MIDKKVYEGLYKDIMFRKQTRCYDNQVAKFLVSNLDKCKDNNQAMEMLSRATNSNFIKTQNDIYTVVESFMNVNKINNL